MYTKGQVVYSKKGRDKGKAFIVYDCNEEYVFLVDGKLRKLEKPKKKKLMHVQMTKHIDNDVKRKLDENLYLNDSDIKKALKAYEIGFEK